MARLNQQRRVRAFPAAIAAPPRHRTEFDQTVDVKTGDLVELPGSEDLLESVLQVANWIADGLDKVDADVRAAGGAVRFSGVAELPGDSFDLAIVDLIGSRVREATVGVATTRKDWSYPYASDYGSIQINICFIESDLLDSEPIETSQSVGIVDGSQEQSGQGQPVGVQRARLVDALLATTSEAQQPVEQVQSFAQVSSEIRTAMIERLKPALNDYIKTIPQATLDEKKKLGRWITAELAQYGLAVECPNHPGLAVEVKGDVGNWPGVGRFQFLPLEADGRKQRIYREVLPELNFIQLTNTVDLSPSATLKSGQIER